MVKSQREGTVVVGEWQMSVYQHPYFVGGLHVAEAGECILFNLIYFCVSGEVVVLREPQICCTDDADRGVCSKCLVGQFHTFDNKNRCLVAMLLLLKAR